MKQLISIIFIISIGLSSLGQTESWYRPPGLSLVVNPIQAVYQEFSGTLQFRIAKTKMISIDAGYGFDMDWGNEGISLEGIGFDNSELRIPVYAKRSWLAEGPLVRLGFTWFQPSPATNANTFIRTVAIYRNETYPRINICHRFYDTEDTYETDESGSISVYGLQALFGVQNTVGRLVGEFYIGLGMRAKQYDITHYSTIDGTETISYIADPLIESYLRFTPTFHIGVKGGIAVVK